MNSSICYNKFVIFVLYVKVSMQPFYTMSTATSECEKVNVAFEPIFLVALTYMNVIIDPKLYHVFFLFQIAAS